MDRLPLVGLLVLGCGEPAPSGPPLSRVDAVAARPKPPVDLDDFCEHRYAGPDAPAFTLPATDAPAEPRSGWTWVNVWATWCEPCVGEMPRLLEWRAELRSGTPPMSIQFLSVDSSAEALAGYLTRSGGQPATMHLADPAALEGWLAQVGLDSSAALPLHLFVDPADKLRCVRMGEIPPDGLDPVRMLMQAG